MDDVNIIYAYTRLHFVILTSVFFDFIWRFRRKQNCAATCIEQLPKLSVVSLSKQLRPFSLGFPWVWASDIPRIRSDRAPPGPFPCTGDLGPPLARNSRRIPY